MVEPGVAKTSFFASSADTLSPALTAYADTPAGAARRRFAEGAVDGPGDPAKIAKAIIACADELKAPKRLVLGSDAYTRVRANLSERLAALDSQKATAFATDRPTGA